MRVLIACVNSAASLIGYDVERRAPFWYCPGNQLRVCGICMHDNALWVASDGTLARIDGRKFRLTALPGPHDNYAHSVHPLGGSLLGVADTGNSRILLISGGEAGLSISPLAGWGEADAIPEDAIHLNDFAPWGNDGVIASAFHYQPFSRWRHSDLDWHSEGWGVIFEMRRHKGHTLSRIVASGLNCPHSLTVHDGDVYCCSSPRGEFYHFTPDDNGLLRRVGQRKVTDSHFLRGVLRMEDGWLLGGSSRRHQADGGGMSLIRLSDSGATEVLPVAGAGEIYDILPWDDALMPAITDTIHALPIQDLEGEFPHPCVLPDDCR